LRSRALASVGYRAEHAALARVSPGGAETLQAGCNELRVALHLLRRTFDKSWLHLDNTQLVTDTFGLAPYRAIVAASGGNMPGSAVLSGFIAIQPEAEVAKQLQLFNNLDNDDYVQRYNEFEDWFKHRPHPRGVCARRQ